MAQGNGYDSGFFECTSQCRCSCHCHNTDNSESPTSSSPQKSHGIFVTLRKKFNQIMKRDVHEPHMNEAVRTLPRARSSDRASSSRSNGVSRSRTMPRKTAASGPSTPVRPSERGSDTFSFNRGRSFNRQSPKSHDAASAMSFGSTLSPSRLHKAVCCFRHDGWTAPVAERTVSAVTDTSVAFAEVSDKLASAPLVPITTQDTGYGHTTAPTMSDAAGGEHADIIGATAVAPFYDQVKESVAVSPGWSLTRELHKLPKYGWYWGPIARAEAEERLAGQPDGAFLLRDSSDDRYLLSLSFRSDGRTLHTRIEHCNGLFSFYAQAESEGYKSVVELIERSMNDSQSGVFCYSRARTPGSPSFPVRLARPVSRFTQVRSLQYLCRFVIRQHTRIDYIQRLPLPSSIKGWLEETQY
jgi:suppressor of cytokine signaling 6/7